MPGLQGIGQLVLIITAQCNLRCAYCYQTAKKSLSMGGDTLRRALDLGLGSNSAILKVLFIGGEPLLEWSLVCKAVEYLRARLPAEKRISYEISTNGLLLTDHIADFLDRHHFGVQLSFDGTSAAQDLRSHGSFATLDAMLQKLRQSRPDFFHSRLRVSATVVPAGVPHFAGSIQYLITKGVQEIRVSPTLMPVPWPEHRTQDLDAQFRAIYDNSLRHLQETGEVPLLLFRNIQHAGKAAQHVARCSAARGNMLAIDADGDVYGCAMFAESYQNFPPEFLARHLGPLRLGNVCDGGLPERLDAYRAAVRKSHLFYPRRENYSSYGKCADCTYVDRCRACPVSSGYDPSDRDLRRIPDFVCAFNRVSLKYRDMFPSLPSPLDSLNEVLEEIINHQEVRPEAG